MLWAAVREARLPAVLALLEARPQLVHRRGPVGETVLHL
jgi:hypothetical protein